MCDLKMESQECHPWRRKGELASVFMLLLFFYMCFKTGLAPAQTSPVTAHVRSAHSLAPALDLKKRPHFLQQ